MLQSVMFFLGTAYYCTIYFPVFITTPAKTLIGCVFLTGSYYFNSQRIIRQLSIFLLGLLWASFYTQWQVPPLPPSLEHNVEVIGTIASIPEKKGSHTRFEFRIEKYLQQKNWQTISLLTRLTWFQNDLKLSAGQRWHLLLNLKPARGFANPAGFDYETWLLGHGISATGFVSNKFPNRLLLSFNRFYWLSRLRQYLAGQIDAAVSTKSAVLIKAVTVGIRDEINQQQWQLFRATGTNHLMAIAGLHIGMAVVLIYYLIDFLWRRLPSGCLLIASPQIAHCTALIFAVVYAALAGFSIPTQRALIMLSVCGFSRLFHIALDPLRAISLALFLVVAWDPLVALDAGFYLSFIAVACIVYGMQQRVAVGDFWWKHGRTQFVVSLGLMPCCLWLFQTLSYSSLLANAIAIPWVGWIIIPVSLLALPLLFIAPWCGKWLLAFSGKNLLLLMSYLNFLSTIFGLGWQYTVPSFWILIAFFSAILLFLAPHGWPGRWQSLLLIMPLICIRNNSPQQGELWFTLLDVGQGLSAVIQTQHHVLIYDTGPKFSKEFDAASAVIIPFLQLFNIHRLDMLIVSHGDMDHSGGADTLLKSLTIKNLYTSVPQKFLLPITHSCQRGQFWQWDGVTFEMLHPSANKFLSGNNRSCVLRIKIHDKSLLLTGDIEQAAEKELLTLPADKLHADILVSPHHGSKTSSSVDFIRAVDAHVFLIASGYQNRYHLPSIKIVNRYLSNDKNLLLNTAEVGAIRIFLNEGMEAKLIVYRDRVTNKKGSFMLPLRLPSPS